MTARLAARFVRRLSEAAQCGLAQPKGDETMAIIATLKTAEDRHVNGSNSIASIPLDKLVL